MSPRASATCSTRSLMPAANSARTRQEASARSTRTATSWPPLLGRHDDELLTRQSSLVGTFWGGASCRTLRVPSTLRLSFTSMRHQVASRWPRQQRTIRVAQHLRFVLTKRQVPTAVWLRCAAWSVAVQLFRSCGTDRFRFDRPYRYPSRATAGRGVECSRICRSNGRCCRGRRGRGRRPATLEYVRERTAFGSPISSFQYTSFVLAELATEIDIT